MPAVIRRTIRWAVTLAAVGLCAWIGGYTYRPTEYDNLLAEKKRIERQHRQLQQIVERLTAENRVAEVEVLECAPDESGRQRRLLRFVEFDRKDRPLPERRFLLPGNVVFFDALVIKFAEEQIAAADPLRGRSIALFRRIYSENQAPAEGQPVDTAGDVPNIYRITPNPTPFERKLWNAFWSYATDPEKARDAGVRVAQGEAVYAPLAPGEKWTLTLENDGGLNLIKQPAPAQPTERLTVNTDKQPDV